jgi:hypothetical protein
MSEGTFTDITIANSTLEALRGSQGVIAPTDNGRDPEAGYARRAAALLAAKLGTTLYLSDRSKRTWGDTPHVKGPATIDRLRAIGVGYMVEQMQEALALGAPDVRAVAPSIPTPDSLSDVLEATGASVVVIPPRFTHQRLLDRWWIRDDLPAIVKERAGSATVLIAHPDGHVELA